MAFHPLVIEFSGDGKGEVQEKLKEILLKVFDFIAELGHRTSVTVHYLAATVTKAWKMCPEIAAQTWADKAITLALHGEHSSLLSAQADLFAPFSSEEQKEREKLPEESDKMVNLERLNRLPSGVEESERGIYARWCVLGTLAGEGGGVRVWGEKVLRCALERFVKIYYYYYYYYDCIIYLVFLIFIPTTITSHNYNKYRFETKELSAVRAAYHLLSPQHLVRLRHAMLLAICSRFVTIENAAFVEEVGKGEGREGGEVRG